MPPSGPRMDSMDMRLILPEVCTKRKSKLWRFTPDFIFFTMNFYRAEVGRGGKFSTCRLLGKLKTCRHKLFAKEPNRNENCPLPAPVFASPGQAFERD